MSGYVRITLIENWEDLKKATTWYQITYTASKIVKNPKQQHLKIMNWSLHNISTIKKKQTSIYKSYPSKTIIV